MNHRGTDGTMAWDRVSRYGEWQAKISENMTFGPATPHDVVAALLIDDGISDRGHRKNILDPDVKVVGISQRKPCEKLASIDVYGLLELGDELAMKLTLQVCSLFRGETSLRAKER